MTKKTEEEQQSLPSSGSSSGGGGSGSRRTSSDEEIAAIQSEIEQVEASYNTSSSSIPSSSPLRRATFNSVRDTLSNLRDRLMVHHNHHSQRNQEQNQQQSTVGQNNVGQNNNGQQRRSILQQLSNRLSILDAAHSSRVPLQVMMMHRNGGGNSTRQQGVPVVTDAPQQTSLMNDNNDNDNNDNDGIEVVLDGGSIGGNPNLSSSRPAISVSANVFSVSTRDLMSVGEGLLHHSNDDNDDGLSSSPPATSTAAAGPTSATGSSTDSSRLGPRRSSVLFASRIVAHQSVRDGSSNVLLASVSSTAVADASAAGQQIDDASSAAGSSIIIGGINSTTVSGGREGMLTSLARSSWHGFGDLGSSNGSPGRRGSSSGGMILSGTASSRDFGSHLHPSISRDKLSTISDIGSSVGSSSLGVVDDHDQDGKDDILDDVDMEEAIPLTDDKLVTNVLYSWGKGIQSLHDDNTDRSIPIDDGNDGDNNAKVSSRLESKSILSIATGQNHSVVATAQGTTYVVGTNIHGCVDPNLAEGTSIYRPQLFESLSNVRVVQVSCGYDHTAALSSNGSVWTWGSNAYGQLGHRINNNGNNSVRDASFEGPTRCRPTGMALGKGRRASSVACGTYYTLVLTAHMSLLACGKALIAGHRESSEFGVPKQLPTLVGLPLVGMAAGDGHAVVITAHGTAFVWGENRHSCCGREYPTELTVPLAMKLPSCQSSSGWCGDGMNIPDEVAIQDAACGLEHTILVTRSGRLLVCGNNNFGQLGIAASELNSSNTVIPVNHPTGGCFVSAEAGIANSLILDDAGDVCMTTGQHGIQNILAGKSALAISAGGDGNLAIIAAAPTGVKLLQRQFSMEEIENPTSIVDAVHGMIVELEDGRGDKSNLSQEIARKSEELLRYPSYLNSLFVNPKQLDNMFERLLRVCSADAMQELARAFERGLKGGLDSLRDTRLIHGEAVRCLLQYILFFDIRRDESVVFDLHGETISTFCDTILSVPFEGYKALHSFATSQYTGSLFVKMLVKPLLRTLNICASYTVDENEVEHFTPSRRAVPVIVAVLSWLYSMAEEQNLAKPTDFYSDGVSEINVETLFSDLYTMKRTSEHERSKQFFITSHPWLLSPGCKRNLLQMESQVAQYKAMLGDVKVSESTNNITVEPFFHLEIEREHLVEQTLEKIKQADPKDIRKRLRVSFKGEEGLDAGGVTKEFFQLLSEELFDINSGLWTTKFGDEVNWFNSDNSWDEKGYEMIGVLFGLALYNSVLLDVRFPMAVYRKLLGLPLGLEDIVDEELRRGLKQLLDYEGDDVEDIFCLSFEVSWMELGEERRLDLKPDGANIPVTNDNREEYVLRYVSWILVDSIKAQWNAFEVGVMRIMEDASLDLFLPEELELLVVGSGILDFKALESNTKYEGGYDAETEVVKNFWLYVNNASKETQVQLLKFATASTKAPIGGLGKMPFIIQRAGPDSDLLPTSHTCFNTLLLPEYSSYEKLENNLNRAVLECEGFGLE